MNDPRPPHLGEALCLDFANGLLDASERTAVLAHAAGCPACEARLRASVAAHERGRARVAGALAALDAAPAPAATNAAMTTRRPPLRHVAWLATAAGLAIAGALWLAPRRIEPTDVRMPPARLGDITARRGGTAIDPLTLAGLAAYNRGDDSTAARMLSSAHPTDPPLDRLRRVYLANAQLALGRPALALATLRDVNPAWVPEPWHSEAQWARMTAYYRTGDRAHGDSLLDLLVVQPGPLRARADSLRTGRLSAR